MKPEALAIYKQRRTGDRGPKERGSEAWDPSFYPYCMPRSFPRIYNFDPLIEIVQTATTVYMMFETNNQVRRIYLDRKKHLEGFGPTILGNSSGRWDGDTLVVETTDIDSLDGRNWIDTYGHPFTDQLHVTERMTRLAEDTLQIDFLFNDPGAYTRPWTGRKVLHLRTGVDLTDTGICQGPLREDYLRDIRQGTLRGQPWHR